MTHPNHIILYVEDAAQSARFYAQLLDKPAIEAMPTFALFLLDGGLKLGLWTRQAVIPAATPVGGSEIGFTLPDDAAVDATYARWTKLGLKILQTPQKVDFGYTFTAQDPDGHRLRAYHVFAD
ncbi:VOC family protein [Achromobacter aloeverae]|uniref:Drug:proton antiporter n=1 Tax=Achromobacter aloeverae TaxID=1750518 RepID=A0A4Q1HSI0_9BURK|nr:VOC family protein [Achromobacter aloeverae]RXN93443.1 drug:proton antiporter [Achromobacter aloeverae]